MDHDTVTLFVQDAITELEQRNARDVVEYLRMMLECDGPDVDGAVSSLVAYGAVTIAWIDRLAAINEKSAGFFDEELAELREGLSGAQARFTPERPLIRPCSTPTDRHRGSRRAREEHPRSTQTPGFQRKPGV